MREFLIEEELAEVLDEVTDRQKLVLHNDDMIVWCEFANTMSYKQNNVLCWFTPRVKPRLKQVHVAI